MLRPRRAIDTNRKIRHESIPCSPELRPDGPTAPGFVFSGCGKAAVFAIRAPLREPGASVDQAPGPPPRTRNIRHAAPLRPPLIDAGGCFAMAVVHFDLSEFTAKARQMGVFSNDQLPFAISRTLNDTMFKDTRPHIIGPTWSSAFTVRNKGLARASMRVETATKGKWSAGVFDALGKADLARHAEGGAKTHSGRLAIPNRARVKLHARGKTPWARDLDKKVPQRALRVTSQGIFVGQGGRLHLMFSFANSASLDQRFDFYPDFSRVSLQGLRVRFPPNLRRAIATAFR